MYAVNQVKDLKLALKTAAQNHEFAGYSPIRFSVNVFNYDIYTKIYLMKCHFILAFPLFIFRTKQLKKKKKSNPKCQGFFPMNRQFFIYSSKMHLTFCIQSNLMHPTDQK